MKKILIITGVAAFAAAGFFAYRAFVPPSFSIMSQNPDHTGTYKFAGVTNSFGNDNSTIGGYSGWDLNVARQSDGTTKFDLMKNGSFVQTLAVA